MQMRPHTNTLTPKEGKWSYEIYKYTERCGDNCPGNKKKFMEELDKRKAQGQNSIVTLILKKCKEVARKYI